MSTTAHKAATHLARARGGAPGKVIGVHVNALAGAATAAGSSQELGELSEAGPAKAIVNQMWCYGRNGYATQMALRPQTIACALNGSPVGQLAWNLECFVDWDPATSAQAPVLLASGRAGNSA